MKKILNDLKLKFEAALWALDPELALIDTIVEQHPELFEIGALPQKQLPSVYSHVISYQPNGLMTSRPG